MEDEKNEKDNSLNPEEGDTSDDKTSDEGQDTSIKPESLSSEQIEELVKKRAAELQKQQYARMKEAEEEAKSLKEELAKKGKEAIGKTAEKLDLLDLAQKISALKDYTADELSDVALIAKAKGIPLEEATQTEEAKALVAARREKVEKEKQNLKPSTKVVPSEKPIEEITAEDISKMSKEEKSDYLEKAGWIIHPRTPKNRGGKE